MKLKPQNLHKHLSNFTSKEAARPILNGVHYHPAGHLEATNSHILLRLYNRIPEGIDFTQHPKTLDRIDGDYPQLERLIPTNHNTATDLEQKEFEKINSFIKSCEKKEIINMVLDDNRMTLINENGLKIFIDGLDMEGEMIDLYFSTEYLKIIFDFLKDSTTSVTMKCLSPIRPVLFTKYGDFDIIISPIRMERK